MAGNWRQEEEEEEEEEEKEEVAHFEEWLCALLACFPTSSSCPGGRRPRKL